LYAEEIVARGASDALKKHCPNGPGLSQIKKVQADGPNVMVPKKAKRAFEKENEEWVAGFILNPALIKNGWFGPISEVQSWDDSSIDVATREFGELAGYKSPRDVRFEMVRLKEPLRLKVERPLPQVGRSLFWWLASLVCALDCSILGLMHRRQGQAKAVVGPETLKGTPWN
jgi:hypothetical protein